MPQESDTSEETQTASENEKRKKRSDLLKTSGFSVAAGTFLLLFLQCLHEQTLIQTSKRSPTSKVKQTLIKAVSFLRRRLKMSLKLIENKLEENETMSKSASTAAPPDLGHG